MDVMGQGTFRSLRVKWIPTDFSGSLDTLLILPQSLLLVHGKDTLENTMFELNENGHLTLREPGIGGDSLQAIYRVLPFPYRLDLTLRDTLLIRESFETKGLPGYIPARSDRGSLMDFGGLERRGTIARGIQVGNAQDLSVSSDLNLQLMGRVTDDISILANISDDNIPIQADGTTQTLQEFDQVYIKLFNEDHALTAGDYQVADLNGRFAKYLKKARGALVESRISGTGTLRDTLEGLNIRAGAAVSRGKFSRNVIQGIEGNQGPYRLRGADNELFIIVLSGTERVYIDGRPLKRGKEYDYTIDYNSAEITFTANRLITKDRRIVVEFQYAERNYARSLLQVGGTYRQGPWQAFMDLYSEQDARNQPLQQELTPEDRAFLSGLGDNINEALISRLDSVQFSEDQVLYALRDSLGYDSIFVYSTDPVIARYRVSFTRVNLGQGDYVQDEFSPNGRIYRWVAPDTLNGTIIRRGDHVTGILLVTPKSQSMYSGGLRYQTKEHSWAEVEAAMSQRDLNTFSELDDRDDDGTALRLSGEHRFALQEREEPLTLNVGGMAEYTSQDFRFIERYREVEFERNWNLQSTELLADQVQLRGTIGLMRSEEKAIAYSHEQFRTRSDYKGVMHGLRTRWKDDRWDHKGIASVLETDGLRQGRFSRHIASVTRKMGKYRLGFRDEREENEFRNPGDSVLSAASYRFYEWEGSIGSGDSTSNAYRLFFRQRDDWRPRSDQLLQAARANEYGLEWSNRSGRRHNLKVVTAWRELRIVRESIINDTPENTFLGRIEYRGNWLKGGVTTSTFSELASGLERRRQYVYLEVPEGQGVYVWNDYNEDGVRDLDEFEVAQFQYEANFIRVFTPTDSFEKTFNNQFAQTVNLDASRWWKKDEKGITGILGRISDQVVLRSDRKTRQEKDNRLLNPFTSDVADSLLLGLNSSFRNSVFFNRIDPVWSIEHNYSDNSNKQLLTNGFETRTSRTQELEGRLTLLRRYTLRLSLVDGREGREASYSSNRRYSIQERSVNPSVEWQPDRNLRLTAKGGITDKKNDSDVGERAQLGRVGMEARFSSVDKGSLTANLEWVSIDYNSSDDSTLAFEMLDGLQTGNNLTWSLFLQRSLSKNLELNITYNGRKAQERPAIHSGSLQLRAFF